MSLGFIGAGAITEAVVTGLCEASAPGLSILLSPRSRERSRALAERYAAVEVAASNQEVADRSELVFLAVRPQVAAEVLAALRFRQGQRVASFIATLDSAEVARLIRPGLLIGRVAPVPPAAQRKGPIAMCPPNEQLAELLDPIGTVIQVSDETQLDAFFSASALMAPYFELLESVQRTTAPRIARNRLLRPRKSRPRPHPSPHARPRHPERHPQNQLTLQAAPHPPPHSEHSKKPNAAVTLE